MGANMPPNEAQWPVPRAELAQPIEGDAARTRILNQEEIDWMLGYNKGPSHYTRLPIQPLDFIEQNDLPFWAGNVIKYVCRAGHKVYPGKGLAESEILDLEKAADYLTRRIRALKARIADDAESE